MKKVKCSYRHCGGRRVHHDKPFQPRGHQYVEVPDDFPEDKLIFCSMECAMYAGRYSVRADFVIPEEVDYSRLIDEVNPKNQNKQS